MFKEQGEETQEDRFLTKLPSYPILKDNSQIIIIVTSTHMSIQEVLLRFTEGTINPVFNTPWLLTGRGYQQSHSSLELQIARVSGQSNYTPQGINPKATTRVTEQITGVSFYILTPQLLSRGEGGELLKGGLQKIPCLLVPVLNYRQSSLQLELKSLPDKRARWLLNATALTRQGLAALENAEILLTSGSQLSTSQTQDGCHSFRA